MQEELKKLIDSVGALAEMTVLYREELLKRGVSQQDALRFTQTFIMASLGGGKSGQAE